MDADLVADAYARIIADDALRKDMGAAGRDRAVKFYDWSVIVPRYEALWAELGERRSKDSEIAAAQEGHVADPLRNDPSQVFSGYPTMSLGEDFQVFRQSTDTELETLIQFKINSAVAGLVPDAPNMRALLKVLPNADASTDVGTLLVGLKAPRAQAFRAILWLAKLGIVQLTPPTK